METNKNRLVHLGIITVFCSLYFLVATISMINSVAFFDLAHQGAMNWSLAIGFELGAAASLAAIIILDKTNRFMVWSLFLLLTAFQMMANSYHAFINLEAYMGWIELFGLEEMEPLAQKRILAIVSGAVLPIIALGFIKSLVDYIRPETAVDTLREEKVFNYLNENDKDVNDFLSHPDNNKEPHEMGDTLHTVGGLTNDKDGDFMKFQDKIEKDQPTQIAKDKPHAGYPTEQQSPSIKEDLGNVVDVVVKDNTTYVTTRPKTEEDI